MTYIIAEIGVNHDGSVPKALDLIGAAKAAGADCVKFQLFDAVRMGEPDLLPLQLSVEQMHRLKMFCEYADIDFLCTAFDIISAQQLKDMGCTSVKLSSRDATNRALIGFCAEGFKVVYLSTGNPYGKPYETYDFRLMPKNVTLMHCVSEYPVPPERANIRRVRALQYWGSDVGYSDHTIDTVTPVVAVSFGASVIEKHFTLDTSSPGADHHMSLDPPAFREMVRNIRHAEVVIG